MMVNMLAMTAGIQSDWSVQNITGQVGQQGLDSQRVLAGSRRAISCNTAIPEALNRMSCFTLSIATCAASVRFQQLGMLRTSPGRSGIRTKIRPENDMHIWKFIRTTFNFQRQQIHDE